MPSIASIFRPKIIRRVLLTALLGAPIVYLFITQFASLAGSHGEEVLADETISYSDTLTAFNPVTDLDSSFISDNFDDSIIGNSVYFVWSWGASIDLSSFSGAVYIPSGFGLSSSNATITAIKPQRTEFVYTLDGRNNPAVYYWNRDWSYAYGGSFRNLVFSFYVSDMADYTGGIITSFIDWLDNHGGFRSSNSFWGSDNGQFFLQKITSISLPQNNRDSLFNNMFGRSNFLTDWGTSVLDDTAVGFEPVNALLQYVGGDMLHLGDTQIGLMALGYSTYVFNVLIVYMLVSLCSSLICLPLKVTDIFNRGENL